MAWLRHLKRMALICQTNIHAASILNKIINCIYTPYMHTNTTYLCYTCFTQNNLFSDLVFYYNGPFSQTTSFLLPLTQSYSFLFLSGGKEYQCASSILRHFGRIEMFFVFGTRCNSWWNLEKKYLSLSVLGQFPPTQGKPWKSHQRNGSILLTKSSAFYERNSGLYSLLAFKFSNYIAFLRRKKGHY